MNGDKTGTVIVQRGTYYMGMNTRDKDGAVVKSQPPKWKPNPEGASVAVCVFDDEKNETIGKGELFAAWDSHGIDQCIREKLDLTRRNFPSPEELYRWIKEHQHGLDLCDICEGACAGYDCRICPIGEVKESEL